MVRISVVDEGDDARASELSSTEPAVLVSDPWTLLPFKRVPPSGRHADSDSVIDYHMGEDRDRTTHRSNARTTGTELSSDTPLDETLPPDLQVALGRFLGTDPVETLRSWTRLLRARVGDGAITVEDLCLIAGETPHRGAMDGTTYHFACFYDAVILAVLANSRVDIRTISPQGVVISAQVEGTSVIDVDPPEAVFSFGIDRHVDPPDETGPSLTVGYESICPYVNAFPTAESYHSWAGTVPAPTVALPLAGATELAATLGSNTDQ